MLVEIRPTAAEELPAVRRLLDEAFGQPDEGELVARLWASEAFIPELSLLGLTEHGEAVAYILFTTIQIKTAATGHPSLALAPMAVWPDFQRKGVGDQLIRAALERAKELGYSSVMVLGHAEYYPKFGFTKASNWDIQCPLAVPDESFMALELQAGALEGMAGRVEYSQPFGI